MFLMAHTQPSCDAAKGLLQCCEESEETVEIVCFASTVIKTSGNKSIPFRSLFCV